MNRPYAQARRIKDIGLVLPKYYGVHKGIAFKLSIRQGNNMPDSRVGGRFRQSSITRTEHLMERFKTKAIESRICKLPHDRSVSAHIGWQKCSCQHALRQVGHQVFQVSFSETSERVRANPATPVFLTHRPFGSVSSESCRADGQEFHSIGAMPRQVRKSRVKYIQVRID